MPLHRHDAKSVADAFTTICCHWGLREIVRLDNGPEFQNAIVNALFKKVSVKVQTRAAFHPQSQGVAEWFNGTLLTLIRKTLN